MKDMTTGAAGAVKSRTKNEEASLKALARGLLGRAIGFRDCTPRTLDALVARGRILACVKGECIARRGEPFDYLGIVIQGCLEASLTRAGGHRHLVGLMQHGDLVGLVPTLDGLGHVNDLWSRGPSATLLVPGADIRQLRDEDPSLARALERQLAFRCRVIFERLVADSGLALESRLCSLLLTLSSLYGLPRDDGIQLDMKLSQSDLADWLGVSRQRINFVVKRLEAGGLFRLKQFVVTITDNAALAARAHETDTAPAPR